VLAPALVALAGLAVAVDDLFGPDEDVDDAASTRWGWGACLLVLLVAGCATPHGPAIYEYVAGIAWSPKVAETVTEWQPLHPLEPFDGLVVAAIVCGLVTLALRARRVALHELAVYVATAALAVSSIRAVYWWAAVALLVVPRHLAALLSLTGRREAEPSTLQGIVHTAVVTALVGAVVAIQPGMPAFDTRTEVIADRVRTSAPGAGLLSSRTPLTIVERLTERGEVGRIFHDQAIGGLLEYRIGAADPAALRRVAFVDQRMGLIPGEIWADYFRVARAEEGWRRVLETWDVQTLVVHAGEQEALIEVLARDRGWRRVSEEGDHVWYRNRGAH